VATDWDKDKPAGSTKIRLSDEQIRANNAALEDAIGRDHSFPGAQGTTAGQHLQVTFYEPLGADPDPGANSGALYLKDDAAKGELHFEDEDDNVIQLSSGGCLGATGTSIKGMAVDHGDAEVDQLINVCYGTGDPPAANTTTIGALFIKYEE